MKKFQFLDLRFNHFSEYAKFILSNSLQEFVEIFLENSFEVKLPLLKYFESIPREELFQRSMISSRDMLSAIADNRVLAYISNSKNSWLSNRLPRIGREQIIAEDITLLSYVRRKTFRALLPTYTNNPHDYIPIMDEVDKFTVVTDSVFLNTLIEIQQEQITASNQELENRERQLLDAQAIGNIGSFELDLNKKTSYYSPQVFSIYEIPDQINLTIDFFLQSVHPEDFEKVRRSIDQGINTGEFFCEYRININAREKHILAKGKVVFQDNTPTRMIGTLMDISEKQTIIKRLEESEAQNKQAEALTHIGNWAWIMEKGEIKWSDELFRIYGLDPQSEEITVQTFTDFLPPDDREPFANKWNESLEAMQVPEQDFKILRRDGTVKILHSKGEIIRSSEGKPLKVIGTIQDITAEFILTEKLKEREHYLNELNSFLAQKNEELISKNKELESFNFITSHDLQEPLRKIQIFTDRLITENSDNFSGPTLNSMARIQAAAHRMQKLIEDFLEFSQTLTPTRGFGPVDLNEIVEEAIMELHARVQEKNAIVIYSNLPTIKAIRYQMKQLFINLISNSLKYAQSGERPVIEINALKEKDESNQLKYKITFRDNGIGFEQKYANKVFDLFQRLHNKNEFSGTGIGLALCKKICENHSGTISVSSEPTIGSTFTITLPLTE